MQAAHDAEARMGPVDVAEVINSNRALTTVLAAIMRMAVELVDGDTASLLLIDEVTKDLLFQVALGKRDARLQRKALPMKEEIARWVAEHRESLNATDMCSDPRFSASSCEQMKYALRTVLAVPVVCGETLVGVLVVVNKRSGGVFTGDDDRLLTLLAEHAAVAVEHAGLIETVRDINTRLGQSATEPGREPGATSAQLNAVLQSINEGIAILGTDFRVQWMNQTMQRWFGECGETGQRTCYKAFCGRDTPCEDFCPCLRALKSGKTEQVKEAVRLLKGVPRSCELTASPIKNEREEVVQIVVAVRDITEHKESELARVHEAELQTLSALVTSVNHEINNPLTAILGNALLLQQQLTGNNGRVAERLNIIADSARRISEVTHKLSGVVLPVSCKYAGNMRMLDLEASTRRNHDA